MSIAKELKNTSQKKVENNDENKKFKLKDIIFFDKGGVDIFQ